MNYFHYFDDYIMVSSMLVSPEHSLARFLRCWKISPTASSVSQMALYPFALWVASKFGSPSQGSWPLHLPVASVLSRKREWASPAFSLESLDSSIPEIILIGTVQVSPPCYYAIGKMSIVYLDTKNGEKRDWLWELLKVTKLKCLASWLCFLAL